MDKCTHLGIDSLDVRLSRGRAIAEQPAKELDGVATHVEGDSAAAATGVEEPGRVGAVVLLRLLHEVNLAESAFTDQLLEPDVLGREAQLFGITQEHPGPLTNGDHPVA